MSKFNYYFYAAQRAVTKRKIQALAMSHTLNRQCMSTADIDQSPAHALLHEKALHAHPITVGFMHNE